MFIYLIEDSSLYDPPQLYLSRLVTALTLLTFKSSKQFFISVLGYETPYIPGSVPLKCLVFSGVYWDVWDLVKIRYCTSSLKSQQCDACIFIKKYYFSLIINKIHINESIQKIKKDFRLIFLNCFHFYISHFITLHILLSSVCWFCYCFYLFYL